MKKRYLVQSFPALIVAAAALPASEGWAASHTGTSTAKSVKSYTFSGPSEDMRWGPVQATITVKNKKITNARVVVSPETSRSQFIDSQAVPLLRQETLAAQSATINEISGATDTSDAYIQSLQVAVEKAQHKKVLK